MLVIREEQMKVFREVALRGFPEELVRYIGSNYPDAPREVLRGRVAYGIACAQTYGIADPNSVAAFVSLMFTFGPRFHLHPSIQSVLRDPVMPPDRRVASLAQTPGRDWLAASDSSQMAWDSI